MSERILEALVDGTHPEHGVVREWALLVYSVLWEGMMVTDDAVSVYHVPYRTYVPCGVDTHGIITTTRRTWTSWTSS